MRASERACWHIFCPNGAQNTNARRQPPLKTLRVQYITCTDRTVKRMTTDNSSSKQKAAERKGHEQRHQLNSKRTKLSYADTVPGRIYTGPSLLWQQRTKLELRAE